MRRLQYWFVTTLGWFAVDLVRVGWLHSDNASFATMSLGFAVACLVLPYEVK